MRLPATNTLNSFFVSFVSNRLEVLLETASQTAKPTAEKEFSLLLVWLVPSRSRYDPA
jgi:hypothetical protein